MALLQAISEEGGREEERAQRAKSDPGKLALAARLRRETTLPIKWIAARLQLGTSKSANSNLHRWMQHDKPSAAGTPTHTMGDPFCWGE